MSQRETRPLKFMNSIPIELTVISFPIVIEANKQNGFRWKTISMSHGEAKSNESCEIRQFEKYEMQISLSDSLRLCGQGKTFDRYFESQRQNACNSLNIYKRETWPMNIFIKFRMNRVIRHRFAMCNDDYVNYYYFLANVQVHNSRRPEAVMLHWNLICARRSETW